MKKNHKLLLSTFLSFLVLSVISTLVYFLEKGLTKRETMVILSDCMLVSGLIPILLFFLIYLTSIGAFSMLSYALFLVVSPFKKKKENQPKDYYEYQEQHPKKKKYPYFLLYSAIPFVIGMIVFTILAS